MKIFLKQIVVYEVITEDGRSLGNFERVSTWEGFDKLASPSGFMVIVKVEGGELGRAFADLLGSSQSATVIAHNPATEKALNPPPKPPFEYPEGTIRFDMSEKVGEGCRFKYVLPADGTDEQALKEYQEAEEHYSLEGAGQKLIKGKWTDLVY